MRIPLLFLALVSSGCIAGEVAEADGIDRAPVSPEECSDGCGHDSAPSMVAIVEDARASIDPAGGGSPSLAVVPHSSEDLEALRAAVDADPGDAGPLLELGRALQAAGEEAEMKDVLLSLIREHPQSDVVPHAYAVLADDDFAAANFEDAHTLFERITQFRDSRMRALAAYRQGWCLLLHPSPNHTKALSAFVNAAKWSDEGTATPYDGFTPEALRLAALNDLVVPYFHVGKPARFVQFIQRLEEPGDPATLIEDLSTALGHQYEASEDESSSDALCASVVGGRGGTGPCPWQ